MTASALGIVALLACMAATSVAQQSSPATETLDEVAVTGPEERRQRERLRVTIPDVNDLTLSLGKTLSFRLKLRNVQTQVAFRHRSAARQWPETSHELYWVNRIGVGTARMPFHMELLPDRIIALGKPWIREAALVLAANIDEADGVPAHIPFGPGAALVNLDHVGLRDSPHSTRIILKNAMHPLTRKCEENFAIADAWADGVNPLVLLGDALWNCNRAARRREGDLLFAADIPDRLRQALQELHDPIASSLAIRLGSEPGTMFVAWWPDAPRDGYRLQLSWNRNSLLLFNGTGWQQGADAAQREALRLSLMREQIQRRIRETDWPGPFTRSAVEYLLLLLRGDEARTTSQQLRQELPRWIAGCAGGLRQGRDTGAPQEDVSSVACGLLLQFVYDAVARSRSGGKQDIYGTWRRLLDASFRRKESGVTPADFLASSADARRIAQGLVDGSVDWPTFAAALDGVGVKLDAVPGGALPAFEVRALEHFRD